jgi:Flp pilus assembly protein TadG
MFRRVRRMWGEGRRGAIVVMLAVVGTVMVGMTAMTIDLGTMYIARTELQRSADAAALAAVAKLTHYQAGTSETAAKNEAERIVEANPVQGRTFKLDLSRDVVFGHSDFNATTKKYTFVAGGAPPTAVQVYVRMTNDSPNGSLKMMFAGILGVGSSDMTAKSASMIIPRDITVVADLSGSMNYDSQLQNYKDTAINLWNVWACLPVQKGSNGAGNGWSPPGNAPATDQGGRMYMTPTAAVKGPVFGRMNTWGTLTIDASYNPATDAGLLYIPIGATSNDINLATWLSSIGYSTNEITTIVKGTSGESSTNYSNRVQVALGLMYWDSGNAGGLWSKVGTKTTKSTNKDTKIDSNELTALVSYPWTGGSWSEYINTYMCGTSTWMYKTNSNFKCRFGLKTFVNYMLESRRTWADNVDLCNTPEQPVQAVKDAVTYCMNTLTSQVSNDQVSLEIYATTARHEKNLSQVFTDVSGRLAAMQAAYYDNQTNMGGGIDQGIKELTSTRGRSNAAKYMFLLTDGIPNINSSGGTDESTGQSYATAKATEAAGKGIKIYCVSVGAEANRTLMQQIAGIGHGEEFFAAGTIDQYSAQLAAIFAELSSKRPIRLIE